MTPIEIHEYKLGWLKRCTNSVAFDEYAEYDCKGWCRRNLKQHEWHFTSYVDWYRHSISFEHETHKQLFEQFLEYRVENK